MKLWNQIWNPGKWKRAQRMRANGKGDDEIAKALGLTETQVSNKFSNESLRKRAKGNITSGPQCTQEQVIDREYRSTASERRTQTQVFCGDPPPGYSALDKIRRGERP